MNLITSTSVFHRQFTRLLNEYEELYWAVAWASSLSPCFAQLLQAEHKIRQVIIGLHFYQTHPDFIRQTLTVRNVRFIKQTDGTFHPKLYLFFNSSQDWQLLVGSANFTSEAFSKNTEATIHLSSKDTDSASILNAAKQIINRTWQSGHRFSGIELENYTRMWHRHRSKLASVSGRYGASQTSRPIYDVPVASMSWTSFVRRVRQEDAHALADRVHVIATAQRLFHNLSHFNEMSLPQRQAIAGTSNALADGHDYGYFGSMRGAGNFKHLVNTNEGEISAALDQIPLGGAVVKEHYDAFLNHYRAALPGDTNIATATRLLAMRRPDVFVCFDSKNKRRLCRSFGIRMHNMTYDRYWAEIVQRIFDSIWWNSPQPDNDNERTIYAARAAFLDALFYEP